MATTGKQLAERRKQRESEYAAMRDALLKIATAEETKDSDRIAAINTIYKFDTEGMPEPTQW